MTCRHEGDERAPGPERDLGTRTGPGPEVTDAEVIAAFTGELEQEEYGLLPGEAKRLTRAAVEWANEKAKTDPYLGNGRDTRAVFALAEGITIGAMAWREAEKRASLEGASR